MSPSRRRLPASYVVRLYRADPSRPEAAAGLIEDLERGVTRSFRSGTELLRHLAEAGGWDGAQHGPGGDDRTPPSRTGDSGEQ